MHRACECVLRLSGGEGAYVERIDAPDLDVEVVAAAGVSTPPLGTRIPYPGSLTEEVLTLRRPLLLDHSPTLVSHFNPTLKRERYQAS